jgi:hypothetical protein
MLRLRHALDIAPGTSGKDVFSDRIFLATQERGAYNP